MNLGSETYLLNNFYLSVFTNLSEQSKRNEKKIHRFLIYALSQRISIIERMNHISELSADEQAAWHEVMLHHSYDFQEWDQARTELIEQLKKDQKVAEETSIRSYLSCCAEAVSAGHPLPCLKISMQDFYERYGMESAQPQKK